TGGRVGPEAIDRRRYWTHVVDVVDRHEERAVSPAVGDELGRILASPAPLDGGRPLRGPGLAGATLLAGLAGATLLAGLAGATLLAELTGLAGAWAVAGLGLAWELEAVGLRLIGERDHPGKGREQRLGVEGMGHDAGDPRRDGDRRKPRRRPAEAVALLRLAVVHRRQYVGQRCANTRGA